MSYTSKNFLKELVAPEDPNIDIVAVHGLNPTNKEFHAEATWTSGDKLWLRDFLPNQLPRARVLLFEYNSNVAFETSTAGVREQAENLLNRLKGKRRGAPERPIIFVCHSLGGIVVNAKLDESYDSIRVATYGIAFFGTPHQGGNGVKLGDIAANIANGFLRHPKNTFLEALKKDSLFADDLVKDFRHQLEDYHVLSFHETRPYKKLGLIVDPKSATLGLAGKREKQIAMDADHAQICKFDKIDGDDYEQVAENLMDLAEDAIRVFTERQRLASLIAPVERVGLELADSNCKSFQMIPFPRNEDVVERKEIFFELDKKLPLSHQHQCAALWGLGGSGKTQIALEFAYRRYDQSSCSVFWVHSDSYARFLEDYKKIAMLAGLSEKLVNDDLMSAVRGWMESQPNWLLVLDNADNLQYFGKGSAPNSDDESSYLYSFIPQGLTGTILWTTRDESLFSGFLRPEEGINVRSMLASEAETLLVSLSKCVITEADSAAMTELLEKLDRLPLAISQVAAYIRRTSTSIKEYVEKLKKEKRRWKLLEESSFDRHRRPDVPNSIMETWQISMDHILKENPCAYKILHIIAYFNNQDIPFELIKAAARSKVDQEKEGDENFENENNENDLDENDENDEDEDDDDEDDDVVKATTRLKEFSFLRLRNVKDGQRSYEMHKLVQEATRYALNGSKKIKRPHFSKVALEIMLKVFPDSDHKTWKRCEIFLPHALTTSAWPEVSREKKCVSDLLSKISLYLFDQGRSREQEPIDIKTVKLRKDVLGERHPDTIGSIASLAATYHAQGRWKEAEEIKLKVLELREEILGEKHPNTINSMANLATTYHAQGRWKEAEEIELKVLKLREEIFGERYPDTINSMANLAATYHAQGRWKEAEEIDLKVLELREEILGERHPDTIYSMANLAATYHAQGRWKEAEEIKLKVLELREEILGERHPDTIYSMASLAATYHQQGRWKEAEEIELKVLKLREEIFGERHPDTINSMANLAATYHQQGRWKEAEEIKLKVLELREEVLGKNHPKTIYSMESLAKTYGQLGRWEEAEELEALVADLRASQI